MNKINIISLGCSKNLVDTELLKKQLEKNNYMVEVDAENSDADITIINTCGFIGDAKEESVNTILEQIELKKRGHIKKIFVMGCLSQRYNEELKNEIPEVDAYFGKFNWKGILNELGKQYDEDIRNERSLTTPIHYAYLKIAEGCNRTCSYCAIPLMTGEYKSRTIEEIVEEAEKLAEQGVKELLVLAQDLTYYGIDLYGKNKLAELIDRLSDIDKIHWIKLHYAYPAGFPEDILRVMREKPKVCKYLDIALQHSSDNMLKLMRRGITKEQTIQLINKIRKEVPGIALRTTLMTGHPGERKEDFEDLLQFVKDMKFERLGVFPYSHEEDTYCDNNYKDDVPQAIKVSRADKIMELQKKISSEYSNSFIGKTIKVIIDRKEDTIYIGRTEFDSPEVDPEVFIESNQELTIGDFYDILVTDANDYDIYGSVNT